MVFPIVEILEMTESKFSSNTNRDKEEFAQALRDVARESILLESAHEVALITMINTLHLKSHAWLDKDRVRCLEWIGKLVDIPDDDNGLTKLKNDYIQYLRIMVKGRLLHGPFIHIPPENELVPLPEYLGNEMSESMPELPRMGPIAPVVTHRSPDGRAHLSAQRIPGGGIFCYLAVSPDAFA